MKRFLKSKNFVLVFVLVFLLQNVQVLASTTTSNSVPATSIKRVSTSSIKVSASSTVAVKSLSINKWSLSAPIGYKETLKATISPSNATNKRLEWSSSNPKVVKVDSTGTITALAVGNATIWAESADNWRIFDTCSVQVLPSVSGVKINKTSTTIAKNGKETLQASILPSNAGNKSVTWSSNNPKVATVDKNGVVTGINDGTAVITARTVDKAKTATCTVKVVTVPVTSVGLNKTSTTLAKGYKEALAATVAPSNATNKNVTWSTSNPKVATVDSKGVVTATGVGSAVITAKTVSQSKVASCKVTVNDITAQYKPSNFKNQYIEVKAVNSNTLRVTGKLINGSKYLLADVTDVKTGSTLKNVMSQADANGMFSFDFQYNFNAGSYNINVFEGDVQYGTYHDFYYGIQFNKSSSGISFPVSKVYQYDVDKFKAYKVEARDTVVNVNSQADRNKIKDLALQITKGKTNNYDKLLAINNWVADNIYYDYDMLSGKTGYRDAIGTLNAKRSVCQGYAELTAALTRSIGIPCKIVVGWGNNNHTDWSTLQNGQSNHAWNAAYVDGRWVILDTTWNSRNEYENGKYTKGEKRYKYFDATIEGFSWDHRIESTY